MTDSIRHLLRQAWHQEVSERFNIKEVLKALDEIIIEQTDCGMKETFANAASSDLSTSTRSAGGYSCLASIADYGDVRNLVAAFANDLTVPVLACFGHHSNKQQENIAPEQNILETIEKRGTINVKSKKHTEDTGKRHRDPSVLQFPGSQLQTLIVQ